MNNQDTNNNVVLVGITPPPYHGQAVATQFLFDSKEPILHQAQKVRMGFSDTIDEVGKYGIRKVFHLFSVIRKTWRAHRKIRGESILYFTPGSASVPSLIRDMIFLLLVRPLFRYTILHFHSGGIPQALEKSNPVWRFLVKRIFHQPRCVIELYADPNGPGAYFKADQTEVVVNGVEGPCDDIECQDDDSFRLLFVGSMRESKGILVCLEALYLVRKKYSDVKLDMIGVWSSDNERKNFEALRDRLGLEHCVTVHGLKTGHEKWQIFSKANAMLFPTHYEAENLPLVIIESMAARLPVISTRWRGIPTLVDDGNGVLVEPCSPEETAEAILKLVVSPVLCERLGSCGYKRYMESYTVQSYQRCVASIIEGVAFRK